MLFLAKKLITGFYNGDCDLAEDLVILQRKSLLVSANEMVRDGSATMKVRENGYFRWLLGIKKMCAGDYKFIPGPIS